MNSKQLGARIRQAREDRRLSQETLAQIVGKDQKAISEYELGTRRIPAIDLARFAEVLDVSIMFFYQGEPLDAHLEDMLLQEFQRLPSPTAQRLAIQLIRALVDGYRDDEQR